MYLPEGYDPAQSTSYETLYLLHGAGETLDAARAWNDPGAWYLPDPNPVSGFVGKIVDESPYEGIVIMPEGGRAGWYTNWVATDAVGHKFNWQSFHMDQLRLWIDGHFRTQPVREKRAIAGLSMGGHGALSYAAQRYDLFSKAASFSGPGDINEPVIQQGVIANEVTKFAGSVPLFGSAIYTSEEGDLSKRAWDVQLVIGAYGSAWTRKNPYQQGLAYKNNQIQVALYSGYGGDSSDPGGSATEYPAGIANDKMYARFKSEGVNVRYCTGVGAHNWRYWRADLINWLAYAYGTPTNPALPCSEPLNRSPWGPPRP